MFKVKPQLVGDILDQIIRNEGLETPLLQKRVLDAWDEVVGEFVARATQKKFIKNQTLFVEINSPALRSDLMMQKANLVTMLNDRVGAFVISELRVY